MFLDVFGMLLIPSSKQEGLLFLAMDPLCSSRQWTPLAPSSSVSSVESNARAEVAKTGVVGSVEVHVERGSAKCNSSHTLG